MYVCMYVGRYVCIYIYHYPQYLNAKENQYPQYSMPTKNGCKSLIINWFTRSKAHHRFPSVFLVWYLHKLERRNRGFSSFATLFHGVKWWKQLGVKTSFLDNLQKCEGWWHLTFSFECLLEAHTLSVFSFHAEQK